MKSQTINEDGNKPKHVAIIMDGNGRWARSRGLPRTFGHKKGAETVRIVVETVPRSKTCNQPCAFEKCIFVAQNVSLTDVQR